MIGTMGAGGGPSFTGGSATATSGVGGGNQTGGSSIDMSYRPNAGAPSWVLPTSLVLAGLAVAGMWFKGRG